MNSNQIQVVKDWMDDFSMLGEQANPELWLKLVAEEQEEFWKATDLENTVKEACDLIWVITGYLHSLGIPTEDCFNEVVKSNYSKIPEEGPILRRPESRR